MAALFSSVARVTCYIEAMAKKNVVSDCHFFGFHGPSENISFTHMARFSQVLPWVLTPWCLKKKTKKPWLVLPSN